MVTKSPAYQLLLVAIVILLLSVGGGVIVHLTNPGVYNDTAAAIWWAFLRLTDPGYLGDDKGLAPRLVSTFLTLAGYVVFLGALVAIMTNALDRLMGFLASGRSPIFEQDHVLIIGWNDRIHALVEEIVHTEAILFAREQKPAIVILCEDYHPEMLRALSQRLDPEVRKSCRLLIRSGNPLEAESLERVDFSHARSIILIADSKGDPAKGNLSDMTLAKVLMSMKAKAPDLDPPPNVVVEVTNTGNKFLAESMGWKDRTEAVVAHEIMGRLFCQTLRFTGIARVYHRLLTDTFGDAILLESAADLKVEGQSLRQVVGSLEIGVPIGYLADGGRQEDVRILDLDKVLAKDDRVVVLSPRARSERTIVDSTAELTWNPSSMGAKKMSILCFGYSSHLSALISEMSAFEDEEFEFTLLWDVPNSHEQERLQRLAEGVPNLSLRFQLGNLTEASEIKQLALQEYNRVLLLADQGKDPLLADAENVLRYVLLEAEISRAQLDLKLVVELNDEDNKVLLTGPEPDVLVTSEILSHLLAQVAVHRSLMWIYEELFSNGGAELRLRCLSEFHSKNPLTFGDCSKSCLEQGAIAVGYRVKEGVNLSPNSAEVLSEGAQLVVVEME